MIFLQQTYQESDQSVEQEVNVEQLQHNERDFGRSRIDTHADVQDRGIENNESSDEDCVTGRRKSKIRAFIGIKDFWFTFLIKIHPYVIPLAFLIAVIAFTSEFEEMLTDIQTEIEHIQDANQRSFLELEMMLDKIVEMEGVLP